LTHFLCHPCNTVCLLSFVCLFPRRRQLWDRSRRESAYQLCTSEEGPLMSRTPVSERVIKKV
jgi:hypothetical protein